MPLVADLDEAGRDCTAAACPDGYTCQPFVGFVLEETCEVLCADDCDCPGDAACAERADESGASWMQCVAAED